MFRRFFAGLMVLTLAFPLHAAPSDDVLDALELDQLLDIMREEGVLYGSEMATDLFAGGENARWQGILEEIYDTSKMDQLVRRNFGEVLGDTDTAGILNFFESDLGKRAVSLELSARRAMIDDSVEEAARGSYHTAEDRVLDRVTDFIQANDLIEANVTGALNASFQFYRGMVDGGGFEMSESEILSDVWAQEAETRKDTEEWIYGFLMMAYGPLEDGDLEKYTAFSASPEGRALNRALFAGFNAMYDEISYALGLAAAQQLQGLDL
ncbi:DUF2059 domain-containing protein [Pelagimonas varians]|uniref:DUF2059 domain-containing protein n=1 Tax=Pelagimonas varians TaxID=696760 RepID=A0A238K8H8_9RHOB|nr:DUF2059 domain-containing protein [Pelagimonas varians]PYG31700.1 uncharacterized protein DUF2059 [Pelagimonas varians]SMX38754.1 hypothetical protein PEV8663_01524 [Pelagimonas varians]